MVRAEGLAPDPSLHLQGLGLQPGKVLVRIHHGPVERDAVGSLLRDPQIRGVAILVTVALASILFVLRLFPSKGRVASYVADFTTIGHRIDTENDGNSVEDFDVIVVGGGE